MNYILVYLILKITPIHPPSMCEKYFIIGIRAVYFILHSQPKVDPYSYCYGIVKKP